METMKTAEEILNSKDLASGNLHDLVIEAMKDYAKRVAQDALDRAGMVVELTQSGSPMLIPADFITETEIITP